MQIKSFFSYLVLNTKQNEVPLKKNLIWLYNHKPLFLLQFMFQITFYFKNNNFDYISFYINPQGPGGGVKI